MNGQRVIACAECGYDLSLLRRNTACPECGTASGAAPELLSGRVSSEELESLGRLVAGSSAFGLASSLTLLSLYVVNVHAASEWSLIPLAGVLLIETGIARFIWMIVRVLRGIGAKLDRANEYGTILALGGIPVAIALVLPLAAAALRDGIGESGEDFVLLAAFLAAFAGIGVRAMFLRALVNGICSRATDRRADHLATASIVISVAAIVACPVGFAFGPFVLALGASVNLAIASLFWRAVQRCSRARM